VPPAPPQRFGPAHEEPWRHTAAVLVSAAGVAGPLAAGVLSAFLRLARSHFTHSSMSVRMVITSSPYSAESAATTPATSVISLANQPVVGCLPG
jgi:hypothetical protein